MEEPILCLPTSGLPCPSAATGGGIAVCGGAICWHKIRGPHICGRSNSTGYGSAIAGPHSHQMLRLAAARYWRPGTWRGAPTSPRRPTVALAKPFVLAAAMPRAFSRESASSLEVTVDSYNGVQVVDPAASACITDVEGFAARLKDSLETWRREGRRGVWLRLATESLDALPAAAKLGFVGLDQRTDTVRGVAPSGPTLPGARWECLRAIYLPRLGKRRPLTNRVFP